MPVRGHVDALAREPHTLQLKPQPLFGRSFEAQFDRAARADHSLPWERTRRFHPQQSCDGSVVEWISGCGGDCSVGGDFPRGDGKHRAADGVVAVA